jgi:WXG100 family type VII secretion target
MDQVRVTPEMIADAANACDTKAQEIDGELASLRSYVYFLQGIWHGVASGTFNDLMFDFDRYATMMHNALTDIASGLRGNFHNYVDNENANLAALKQVNGSIPGGANMPGVRL